MHQRKPNDWDPTGVRDKVIQTSLATAQDPKGKVVTKIMMQLETAKIRPGGGATKTKSNAIAARDGDI